MFCIRNITIQNQKYYLHAENGQIKVGVLCFCLSAVVTKFLSDVSNTKLMHVVLNFIFGIPVNNNFNC